MTDSTWNGELASTIEPDAQWFVRFPKRLTRIREPLPGEGATEFRSLGPHDRTRRRILVAHVPDGKYSKALMHIPFLLHADEDVANEDHILLPILNEIMSAAAKAMGFKPTMPKIGRA